MRVKNSVTAKQLEALGFSPVSVGNEDMYCKTDLFTKLTTQICSNSGEITVLDKMGLVIDIPRPHHVIGLVIANYIDRG